MSISRFAVAAAAFAVLTVAASASTVVGTWKGKLSIDKSKLPASAQSDKVQQAQAMFSKIQVTLTFKKDGTFSSKLEGVPGQKAPKMDTGKWVLKGSELEVTQSGHTQKFTLAKNGKSFSAPQMPGVMVTFTR